MNKSLLIAKSVYKFFFVANSIGLAFFIIISPLMKDKLGEDKTRILIESVVKYIEICAIGVIAAHEGLLKE